MTVDISSAGERAQREREMEIFGFFFFPICEFNPRIFNIYTDSGQSLALPRHDHEVASIFNWVPKAQAVEGQDFYKNFFVPTGFALATGKQEVLVFKALINSALLNFTEEAKF